MPYSLLYFCLFLIGFSVGAFAMEPLAQDSARFARYWDLERSGQSAKALESLRAAGDGALGCTQQMASFLQAWESYNERDFAGVILHLDRGSPAELADYADWLRARALSDAGNPTLAKSHWQSLARDSVSVHYPEALLELARLADRNGDRAQVLSLYPLLERAGGTREGRQELALLAGRALAAQKRHDEAVELLWKAYMLAPSTDEADRIRAELSGYAKKYGRAARPQTRAELAEELNRLADGKFFTRGLKRVTDEQKRGVKDKAESLSYYKGRYQSGLGRHRDAVTTLQQHLRTYPNGEYQAEARLYLGRSAYLTDQDGIAVPALSWAGNNARDVETAGQAWDLLGLLHLDRERPKDAVEAYRKWAERCGGSDTEPDCLWKLGRALWEAGLMSEAADVFGRLAALNEMSDYASAGHYWSSRAAEKAGNKAAAQERAARLMATYPYSYYGVVAPHEPDPRTIERRDLAVPSLDDLWSGNGRHSRKFALLTAMRLTDLAMKELPALRREWPKSDGVAWWKAQLHLWQGNRSAAWLVLLGELGPYLRSEGARPADFFRAAYPLEYEQKIISLSRRYNIDPYFVFGLICQESHYNASAVSPVGAIGLMQLMPATARLEAKKLGKPYTRSRLFDPNYNLELGIAHLAGLLGKFNGDTLLVLASYNAGANAAQRWSDKFGLRERDVFIERVPYRETRLFIKRNIEHQAAYRRLYPTLLTSGPGHSSQ